METSMLNAKIIMFSRSLTKDYRWIYSANFLAETDKSLILNDYKEFENNKEKFIKEKHLFIRQLHKGIVLYKFLETKDTDQSSRKIYALLGCMFSELDFEIVHALFQYIIPYFYEEFNVIFDKYLGKIPEKKENLVENIEFSLDLITNTIRKNSNMKLLANKILNFTNLHPANNFIIKNNMIHLYAENCKPDFKNQWKTLCESDENNKKIIIGYKESENDFRNPDIERRYDSKKTSINEDFSKTSSQYTSSTEPQHQSVHERTEHRTKYNKFDNNSQNIDNISKNINQEKVKKNTNVLWSLLKKK